MNVHNAVASELDQLLRPSVHNFFHFFLPRRPKIFQFKMNKEGGRFPFGVHEH